MSTKMECKVCNGKGWVEDNFSYGDAVEPVRTDCPYCDGTGYEIPDVPKGSDNG